MSCNPNAIHILEKNLDKINWILVSNNPNAISLMERNLDKINWVILSKNPNAHLLLEKINPEIWKYKIDFEYLCRNPNALHLLFDYNYFQMKQNNMKFAEELMMKMWNPRRVSDMLENGLEVDDM